MGAAQLAPFRDIAVGLGYPAYFMSILGAWYIAAGVVLMAPRLPRLKEWAYAGLVINYTGAAASHIAVGDGAPKLAGPAVFLFLTAASWALRPHSRRDLPSATGTSTRGRLIAYWVATVAVATEMAVGGVWDLLRTGYVLDVIEHLGYPAYLSTIMGFWKIAGAATLLIPGFPRLKEWAYAGATINYASAVASHLIVDGVRGPVIVPLALLGLTIASWALRKVVVRSWRRARLGADVPLRR